MDYTARKIANYVLALSWDGAGDEDDPIATSDITQMKLHKLLYFIQGFSLALLNRKAFMEPIEAWDHGPVVRDVYDMFKVHGKGVLPRPDEAGVPDVDEELAGVIDEVLDLYGQYSAWKLRNLTHIEGPWQETTPGQEIDVEVMRAHFATRIKIAV
jgi:uncharacterized phage-associated protein